MTYTNYTLVAVWKAQAAELGLNWRDVRATYNELRQAAREYEATIHKIRRLAFRLGIRKNHPAFTRGDIDLDSIRGFDVVAAMVAEFYPWIKDAHDDPAPKLFELLKANVADFTLTDDEAWKAAIERTFEEYADAADCFCPEEFETDFEGAF